ncbi:MAG: cytochrome c [Bacteroidota bacterium]
MKFPLLFLLIIFFTTISFTNRYGNNSATLESGKESYDTYCIACHQADGKGQKGVNPPLAGSNWVKGEVNVLIKTVLQGLNTPIEVEGVKYNNAMPAFDYLEDAEMASLLTYVRKNFGQMPDSVTVAQVKFVRDSLK